MTTVRGNLSSATFLADKGPSTVPPCRASYCKAGGACPLWHHYSIVPRECIEHGNGASTTFPLLVSVIRWWYVHVSLRKWMRFVVQYMAIPHRGVGGTAPFADITTETNAGSGWRYEATLIHEWRDCITRRNVSNLFVPSQVSSNASSVRHKIGKRVQLHVAC